jgi:hypothetical protein
MKIEQYQWSAEKGWGNAAPFAGASPSAQLVLLFAGIAALERSRCLAQVRAAYPNASIIGCTTAGEIHGPTVRDDTVAVTALTFEHTKIAVAGVKIDTADRSFEAGRDLVAGFAVDGLKHIFVLSEGMQVNGSELVRGMGSALPAGVTLSGGFAGDGNRLKETYVWCDGDPEQRSAVAFALYGDRIRATVSAYGGWDPFGPDRMVTKSVHNVLYELDGKPALALYREYLGEHAAGLPASGLLFPLELKLADARGRVLRALLGIDEDTGSIMFAGGVPERTFVRLMFGQIEHLIEGAQTAAQIGIDSAPTVTPEIALIVSCNGRRPVLKQRVEEEVEAVCDVFGPKTMIAGFYSYGEIAPAQAGGHPELHNQTMTITTLSET